MERREEGGLAAPPSRVCANGSSESKSGGSAEPVSGGIAGRTEGEEEKEEGGKERDERGGKNLFRNLGEVEGGRRNRYALWQ